MTQLFHLYIATETESKLFKEVNYDNLDTFYEEQRKSNLDKEMNDKKQTFTDVAITLKTLILPKQCIMVKIKSHRSLSGRTKAYN